MSSKNNNEKVIELSVEETNKLRAQLGLAPLRVTPHSGSQEEEAVLELSVNETNTLRERLGLAPLRTSSKKATIHAPAENQAEQKAAVERIEQAKLQRKVQEGMARFADTTSLGKEASSAKSWAAQMRKQQAQKSHPDTSTKNETMSQRYEGTDLKGINVAHSLSELQEGSTTVLTLADAPLLAAPDDGSKKIVGLNEDQAQLENVNLSEARRQSQGLKEKRKLELGMGRAGGYAGFDDDEFEELGGTQAPSRIARNFPDDASSATAKPRGFQIGAHLEEQEKQLESDLFAAQHGKAVSLDPSRADVAGSDFMTVEEDEAMRQERKKKKEAKFKKQKKKSKTDKKKKRRKMEASDSEEEGQRPAARTEQGKGLLDELEETAVGTATSRKRRREQDDTESGKESQSQSDVADAKQGKLDKRTRYDEIMAKGNQRTREAFAARKAGTPTDEEPDDAFLNAALAKARRLNRLKAMSDPSQVRGADAVVEAVKSAQAISVEPAASGNNGTITFSVDETREFTRALRARTEQTERAEMKKPVIQDHAKKERAADSVVKEDAEPMETEDIHELAKEVKEEPDEVATAALDGSTGTTVPVGRGVGSVLNFLKQTGEMTRKNAGKEEMRGRAKDTRTYEDYEPINLSEVVKIDERTASEKDKELAKREVKLEYRDQHGRLLTRKEAFRDLSYQFHGYGSGKRKEEKRLKQIAREQAEARLASRQAAEGSGAGTFGALKATQKATGKAFVVHKTQS